MLPAELLMSASTLAAVSVGPLVARPEEQPAARQAHLQPAEGDVDPLPFGVVALPHADPRQTRPFGRACDALDRNPTYVIATYLAGAIGAR